MPKRPNVLLLFTDQQRYDTIGALGSFFPYIQTPALDSLVREGVSFTSAYTPSPVCIAARCSLILSQWPHQTGCTTNAPMPQDRTSLMEILYEGGYQTHGVGKMHFSPDSRKLWGFESRDYSEEGGRSEQDDFSLFLAKNGYEHVVNLHGLRSEFYYIPQPSQLPERLHHTRWVADRSLEFLKRRDRTRPFFLWTSFIKPHPPFESPFPWTRLYKPVEVPYPFMPPGYEDLLTFWNRVQNRYKYRDQGFDGNLVRLIRAQYCACISYVDYNVGRILTALRDQGELDNTLVIFTSDHGEMLGDYGSYGKRCLLDPASRVPLIVRYPERFAENARCDTPVSLVDILPTVLQATDIGVTEDRVGIDLASVARGECDREGVLVQFNRNALGLYGIVTAKFKYAYSAADGREWLFERVPGQLEERNLAGSPGHARTLRRLRSTLIRQFRRDGYVGPLDGDVWRQFPKRELPTDPDAWQLFQEGGPVEHLFPEGYTPRCKGTSGLPLKEF